MSPSDRLLRRARVQHFKCFVEAEAELAAFTVLVGPNDSGKSTFLQALSQVLNPAASALDDPSWFHRKQTDEPVSVEAALGFDGHELLRTASARHHEATVHDLKQAGQPPAEVSRELRGAVDRWLQGLRLRRLDPRAMHTVAPVLNVQSPSLQENGEGICGVLEWLLFHNRDAVGRVVDTLRAFRPRRPEGERLREPPGPSPEPTFALTDIELEPAPSSAGIGRRLAFRIDDVRLDARFVSDGLVLLTALLLLSYYPEDSTPLLLEEPENAIHPGLLPEVVAILRGIAQGDHGPRRQVLVTTHSPYLLDQIKPDEDQAVLVFQRDAQRGARVTRVQLTESLRALLRSYLLGDAWVVFGEGGLVERGRA